MNKPNCPYHCPSYNKDDEWSYYLELFIKYPNISDRGKHEVVCPRCNKKFIIITEHIMVVNSISRTMEDAGQPCGD